MFPDGNSSPAQRLSIKKLKKLIKRKEKIKELEKEKSEILRQLDKKRK